MGYSIKQKIDICLMAESNPEMTQQDLAHWAKIRYGSSKPPSQTTISRILAKKDEFITLKEHEFKLIRRRRFSNPLLRKVLLEWISQNVWNNIPISPPIILSSAGNLWKQIPENLREGNGEFSYRWCSQFLSKVNIQLNNVENELYNKLKVWSSQERSGIKDLLSNFDPRKIFTLTELFISHDLPLDRSYYADNSDFLTCMLCVNIDGTEKLDPLIIGRYENYPSFEHKPSARVSSNHGITYHSNRKKWLTSTLFYDWLSVLDKRLALTNRDIVLILDDSASHRVINIKLERIRLLYTSSSPNFSPMKWGIENDFKLNFRIKQFKSLILKQRELGMKILSKEEQSFKMTDIFDFIKEAWSLVPELRIQSAWKKSGILPEIMTRNFAKHRLFDDRLESELLELIEEFQVIEKWEVLTLLDLTVEQKINKIFLSNEEIIESCIVENYNDHEHSSFEPNKRAPFSHNLGKPLARLQKLGERLNHNTNNSSFSNFEIMNFDPFEFYSDGNFDFDQDNSIHNEYEFSTPQQQDYHNQNNLRTVQLQPMSELVVSNNLSNNIFNSNLIEDEFMEVELPWSNFFKNQTNNTTPGSTPISSIPNINDSAYASPNQSISFQQNTLNQVNPNLNESQKRYLIVSNFLNFVDNDNSIQLSDSTLNELRLLQSHLSNLY